MTSRNVFLTLICRHPNVQTQVFFGLIMVWLFFIISESTFKFSYFSRINFWLHKNNCMKLINNTNITGHNTSVLFHRDPISPLFNYFVDFTINNVLHEWVHHTLDVEKIKSIIPISQDIIPVFFFIEIQFQLYSKILSNMSTKTDYLTSLLLHHSGWLIWELMIVLGVPV